MIETNRCQVIRENYLRIRENIEKARSRRPGAAEVRILAATKTVPPEEILYAVKELGVDLIGENRTTELTEKYPYLAGEVELHFIGHLQTNKAKHVVGRVSLIESVDSLRLAEKIHQLSLALGTTTDILLEVNSGREENKSGFLGEEIKDAIEQISAFSALRIRGLMTMAPVCTKKEEYRKYFSETYQIFIDFFTKNTHNIIEPVFPVLSMGMSDSYEIAVEEGATEVRVGSALFGRRPYPPVG